MKVFGSKAVFIFSVFLLCMMGCGEKRPAPANQEADTITKKGVEKIPEDAVALVGGEAILEADIDAVSERIPERSRERLRMRTVYYLTDTEVYAREAREMGLHEDPEFQREMKRRRKEILSRAFLSRGVEPNIEPTEAEIREYYDTRTDEFVVPEGREVQRIRVVKKEDAQKALKALEDGGTFLEVARQWSRLDQLRDRDKKEWLYRKRIDPALEEAVFAVDVGAVSGVVQTENEYQVVKVLGTSEENLIPFEDVKSRIRFRLMQRNKREMIHDYYQRAAVEHTPGEGILVKVGDTVFEEALIADILARAEEGERGKLKKRWTQYFIETTVFSQEAEKAGLEDDPQIARQIRWKQADVLADAYRKRVVEKHAKITDDDIAEEYEGNLDAFERPLHLKLALIVVDTREEADNVRGRVGKGMPFSVLARETSVHPSAEEGGGVEWSEPGDVDPVIEKVAVGLQEGQVSDVLALEDQQYGVVKLIEKRGAPQSLEEVKPRIKMVLHRKRMENQRKKYYEKWNVKILAGPAPVQEGLEKDEEDMSGATAPEGEKEQG